MRRTSRYKGGGYLTSTLSVLLLAVPALKSAAESTLMAVCLGLGVFLSISGMGLRWRSHRIEVKQQERKDQRQDARDERQDRTLGGKASFG